MVEPIDFFKDQLPQKVWPVIPTVLRTAYAAARELAASDPILQVESAEDNRGRIVTWAVDFSLKRAVENGSIPCDYQWCEFAKPTGRYLKLIFSHSTASVSQVEDPKKQPRTVKFRETARLRSRDLFTGITPEEPVSGIPHFILVHGHQTLSFAHFGLPSARSSRNWSWTSDNFMKLPHELPTGVPAAEDTEADFEAVELLKEDIERWSRERGDE